MRGAEYAAGVVVDGSVFCNHDHHRHGRYNGGEHDDGSGGIMGACAMMANIGWKLQGSLEKGESAMPDGKSKGPIKAELIELKDDQWPRIIVGDVMVEVGDDGVIAISGEHPWTLDFPNARYEIRSVKNERDA